jgi:hypothetical protein
MTEPPFSFVFDPRLGLKRPRLNREYEALTLEQQEAFELGCLQICAEIPEQIRQFEQQYMYYFAQLTEVDDESFFDQLNAKMNDISSRINDLNLLYLTIEGTYLGANVHG